MKTRMMGIKEQTTEQAYNHLRQLIRGGTMTYKEAANEMNKAGYKTRTGKKWNANLVASWVFNQNHGGKARKYKNIAPIHAPKMRALSAAKKLSMIKQIVMGLHQS